ncbi:TlpA family protein disulfide reductase [Sulfobacillus harzensis]|uniref:Thioredoxin domain-containing protein n=1 Tax=Sulfobacillus harzensis TaxID=2729629 RepID=A0A7Y0L4K7_9FIRM|nr:hypothetical protein [Sulfobacillus harzensis]NMP23198.1 hypothetical protein [Sulfobacillus harzensis]
MAKKTGSKKPSMTAPPRRAAWLWWAVLGAAAAAALIAGYRGLGNTPKTGGSAALPPIVQNPPTHGFTWAYRAYSITSRKPAKLVRGQHITVVMLMASWCLYCAYDDKYVWPAILHTPGLQLDIVDVSPHGGIGDPGPQNPPFSGHDNYQSSTIGASQMIQTMRQYRKKFHLTDSNVHIYVDPKGMRYWSIQDFPTVLIINGQGHLAERINGALTVQNANKLVAQVVSAKSGS